MTEPVLALPAGIENDPEVFAAIKQLALLTIAQTRDLLLTAAPSVQQSVIRMLLPQLTRSLANGNTDDNEDLKKEVSDLYAEVRASLGHHDD